MLQLHDNISFDERAEMSQDHIGYHKGIVTLQFECYATSETDVRMQLIQTLGEMGVKELIENKEELNINLTDY